MNRRDILKAIGLLPFLTQLSVGQKRGGPKVIKPKRLKKGDTVAIMLRQAVPTPSSSKSRSRT